MIESTSKVEEIKTPDNKETPEQSKQSSSEEGSPSTSNPAAERASSMGWMPKQDWIDAGHNEDDWKPAKTFIEYGEMIGKLRTQSKEINDTRQALHFATTKNKEVYERGYQAALVQLRTEKRQALAQGDLVKADELDEKIDATKTELQAVQNTVVAPVPKANQVDPEHTEWLKTNSWYNQAVMQKFADALAVEYIRINNGQVTPNQIRDFVAQEVRKEFPHRFKQDVKGAPNPDGGGKGVSRADGGDSKLDSKLSQAKAGMTDAQRSIMKTMMKSAGLSEKEYLQMYAA